MDKTDTGWLCEWLHATGPEWWTLGGEDGGYFAKDSIKALRFARKEDAQAYIDDAGWTEIVPTEHEWSDRRAAPQALGADAMTAKPDDIPQDVWDAAKTALMRANTN